MLSVNNGEPKGVDAVLGDGLVPNLSGKLRRGSLRYQEAVELADALGYDLVWQKRKERR